MPSQSVTSGCPQCNLAKAEGSLLILNAENSKTQAKVSQQVPGPWEQVKVAGREMTGLGLGVLERFPDSEGEGVALWTSLNPRSHRPVVAFKYSDTLHSLLSQHTLPEISLWRFLQASSFFF